MFVTRWKLVDVIALVNSNQGDVGTSNQIEIFNIILIGYQSIMETYTITFGDMAETHAGMAMVGQAADCGFSYDDLVTAKNWFEAASKTCELFDLTKLVQDDVQLNPAYLLVVRDGVSAICDPQALGYEQWSLEKDKKAFMRGRVVNKLARHNLVFGDVAQQPDYQNKKGTVVAFDQVPILQTVREKLGEILGPIGTNMMAEGNYYYDPKKCGIGWHGDGERRKVVALRLGASMNFCYHWFQYSKPIGSKFEITLNHGDLYIMSDYAVGWNWLKKITPTLRHAAGAAKYTKLDK